MSIGNAIRAARERRGLTQQELAAQATVSVRSLQNWEQGRTLVPTAPLVRIADALGLRVAELLRHLEELHEVKKQGPTAGTRVARAAGQKQSKTKQAQKADRKSGD